MSDDLIAWLRGVLDEDERARAPKTARWTPEVHESDCAGDHWGCTCGRPASVLADIEAKRAILDLCADVLATASEHFTVESCDERDAILAETVLRRLASAYSSRPGYQERWRP